jgi:LacI family transcriptional regulator
VRGIEDALREQGYTALIGSTDSDPAREEEIFRAMQGRRVDGFIIATARREHPLLQAAAEQGIPIVQLSRVTDDAGIPAALVDDTAGMRFAVDHCVSLGHRRLAHLAGPHHISTGETRTAAFVAACKRHGAQVEAVVVECDAYRIDSGAEAAERLLSKHPDVTAILGGNDLIALGAYRVLAEHGLRIPQDVSVGGFNDMPFVDMFSPPLTTVHVPQYHIGVEAARLLLERLEDSQGPAKRLLLPSRLVVRGSTGPPPTAARGKAKVRTAKKAPRAARSSG